METAKEYLKGLLQKWNQYDELDGITAITFKSDIELLLEFWDERIQPLERIPEETTHTLKPSDIPMHSQSQVKPLQNGEREYSKNERAEKLVGKRMADGIIIDFPAELDYHCPVCKYEQENSEGNYDERLDWSEYNGFIYCHKCNKDYPSCLCMPDKEKAIKIYLDCIEDLLSQSKKEGYQSGCEDMLKDTCVKIGLFIESESGKSGRKEILAFIESLTNQKKDI